MNINQDRLNTNKYYTTSDLALASTLAIYYQIEYVDRQNPSKAIFAFKRDGETDKLVEAYWRGEVKVNPITFFNQLKLMKSRLYEE